MATIERKAKLAQNVALVTCGNKIFRDKNKVYESALWGESKFNELISRGFLIEVKEHASPANNDPPRKVKPTN